MERSLVAWEKLFYKEKALDYGILKLLVTKMTAKVVRPGTASL